MKAVFILIFVIGVYTIDAISARERQYVPSTDLDETGSLHHLQRRDYRDQERAEREQTRERQREQRERDRELSRADRERQREENAQQRETQREARRDAREHLSRREGRKDW